MKALMLNPTRRLVAWLSSLVIGVVAAADPSPAWPRRAELVPHRVALYEPAVESYDQEWLKARAAVSVARNEAEPVFGAIWFGLRLNVNEAKTMGRVIAFRLDQMRFPEGVVIERGVLDRILGNDLVNAELELAPLLASLERERAAAEAAATGNQAVPDILFTTVPVALVRIDGEAELRDVPDSDLLTVTNSNTAIFLQKGSAKWFMCIDGRWLTAGAVQGPWEDVQGVPESVRKAMGETAAAPQAPRPVIVVVTRATEVIAVDGEPRYTVIPGTDLLYVNNTDADLFLDIAGQKHYVLLAGRWFATTNLEKGPWEVVPGERLPPSFAAIPPSSPKFGVLAHVPGTDVATEAVQDAAVPRTQRVKREDLDLRVEYEGEPEFAQAGQTTVYYAVNTPYSVVRVDPYYYLCHGGVWYYGGAAWGPWTVCVSVPGVIYTIPPACPVYPVTYVRVYDWTPDVVWFGFTSGYVGWYVGWSGLVFGFAYYDDDWWHHHHRHHGHYYRHYDHGYHCGSYPHHGWRYDHHREWRGWPVHAAGKDRMLAAYQDRPGPEYHEFAGSGARGKERPEGVRPTSYRQDRYDQEPTASLAGKARADGGPTMASVERAGKTGRMARPGDADGFRDTGRRDSGRREPDGAEPGERVTGKPAVVDGGAGRDQARNAGKTVAPRDADSDTGRGSRPTPAEVAPADTARPERTHSPKPVTPTVSRDTDTGGDRGGDRGGKVPVSSGTRGERPDDTAPTPKTVQPAPERTQPEARPEPPAPQAPAKQPAPKDRDGSGRGGKVNSSYFEERYGKGLVQTEAPRPAPVVVPEASPLVRSSAGKESARSASGSASARRSGSEVVNEASPEVHVAPARTASRTVTADAYEAPRGRGTAAAVVDAATAGVGSAVGKASRSVPAAVEATGSAGKSLSETIAETVRGAASTGSRGGGKGGGKGR